MDADLRVDRLGQDQARKGSEQSQVSTEGHLAGADATQKAYRKAG